MLSGRALQLGSHVLRVRMNVPSKVVAGSTFSLPDNPLARGLSSSVSGQGEPSLWSPSPLMLVQRFRVETISTAVTSGLGCFSEVSSKSLSWGTTISPTRHKEVKRSANQSACINAIASEFASLGVFQPQALLRFAPNSLFSGGLAFIRSQTLQRVHSIGTERCHQQMRTMASSKDAATSQNGEPFLAFFLWNQSDGAAITPHVKEGGRL